MNLQQTIPEPTHQPLPTVTHQASPWRHQNQPTQPRQQTLWNFIQTHMPQQGATAAPSIRAPPKLTRTTMTQDPTSTPQSTPLLQLLTQSQRMASQPTSSTPTYQPSLLPERNNESWGDCWAMTQPTNLFRVISKNTRTLNLLNLDMQAITTELNLMSASGFAAQETNVHWNEDSLNSLVTQCRCSSPQIKIAMATSTEKSKEWYKPGGTHLLTLNKWTSRVMNYGMDTPLGQWSYLEFIGKNAQWLIIVSGYRVCPQPFDTALQTTTAQQIRLLQAQGVVNPKLRTLFISEIICKIKTWRQAHYDILLCMDANENTDNPKAKISRLFQETDFLDLHHHRYPGHCKPATQQQGCHPIDIMVGSLCVTEALIHAWIRLFGHPATIKGDHHLLGIDLELEVLFGNATTPPMTHIPRGVNSRYPQKVTKFCKWVVTQCNCYKLAECIQQLQTLPTLDDHHLHKLEDIDRRLTKSFLMLTALAPHPRWIPGHRSWIKLICTIDYGT